MKTKNLLRKAFLLLALVGGINSAWAADAVSATQTFTNERATCTWTSLNASVSKNATCGADGLYFEAGSSGTITTSSGVVNIKSGRTMYVEVPSATSSGSITIVGSQDKNDRTVSLNSGSAIAMKAAGASANFVATDVENVNGGYYIKVASTSDFKFKEVSVTLNDEKYPEATAADPEFSLTSATISTSGASQIQVGSKGNLDGIELSSITYGTSGVVTVDENGVVTPVAAGTTTITFNSSAVAAKYNATEGSSVEITVYQAIPVFDGAGLINMDILLTKANVDYYDFLSTNSSNWADKDWEDYVGSYLDMKAGRTMSIKMKNVTTFEVYLSGGEGRKYTVKVGDADAVEYTQSTGSGFASSGVIATGTTDEVTIVIEGGEKTLYPVYVKVNPAASATVTEAGYATFVSDYALDFTSTSIKAYKVKVGTKGIATMTQVDKVPAGTPVLLYKNGGATEDIPAIVSADAVSDNDLVAGTGANVATEDGDYTNMILNVVDEKVGFYFAAGQKVATNRAYLHIAKDLAPEAAGSARGMRLEFAGNITGINEAKAEAAQKDGKFVINGQLVIKKNGKIFNAAGAQLY